MRRQPMLAGTFGLLACLLGLLLAPTHAAVAPSSGSLSTINILHRLSFQYPSSWALIPDSTHLPLNPQSDAYGNNEWRNDRGSDPRMSNTVEVMNAGLPIAAPHAASSISTTGRGQLRSVSLRNSSGDSSSNLIRSPKTSPMTLTCSD